jgi:hypothetical protein
MKFEEPRRDNAIIKKTRAEGLRQLVHRTNFQMYSHKESVLQRQTSGEYNKTEIL